MSQNTITSIDAMANLIVDFWFDPRYDSTRWFTSDPAFDAGIISKFGNLVPMARDTSDLDHWAESPLSCLALILLLDQFPRNVYRNSPDAYGSDPKALKIATTAVACGLDRQLSPSQQAFMYLPFEHNENLQSQVTSVALFEGLVARCQDSTQDKEFVEKALKNALGHRHVIITFGRYPARNTALHRQSTAQEVEFLKTHPFGL